MKNSGTCRPWAITVRIHVDGALILPVGRDTRERYLNRDVNRHHTKLNLDRYLIATGA